MKDININAKAPIDLIAILNYGKYEKEVGFEAGRDGVDYSDNCISINSSRAYLKGVKSIDVYAYAGERLNKYDGSVTMYSGDEELQSISFQYDKSATNCCHLFNIDLEAESIVLRGNYIILKDLRDRLSNC